MLSVAEVAIERPSRWECVRHRPRYLCEGPNLRAIRTARFTLERVSTTPLAAYRQLCRAGRPCRLKSRSWRVSFFQADVSRYPGYMRGSVASYVICVTFCALGPRKGLSDYGRSSRRELRRKCDGRHSAANTTNGTPVTGVPKPSITPSTDTLHAFHHVGVSSHRPLDGHNNGADLRCNSWFGKKSHRNVTSPVSAIPANSSASYGRGPKIGTAPAHAQAKARDHGLAREKT